MACWLVIALLGVVSLMRINSVLTAVTDVPGSLSSGAEAALRSTFNENITGNFVVVFEFGDADQTRIADFKARIVRAAADIPTAEVLHQQALGGVLYANVGTALDLIDASAQTTKLRAALEAVGLRGALVTGPPALEHDVRPILAEDLQRGGVAGVVLAMLVLLVALGRLRQAVIPVAAAVVTMLASVFVVYLLAQLLRVIAVPMVLYVPNIVELVALGLAIDYGLLIVHRYRQQVAAGSDDPLEATMRTAGRTVWWAGTTAAIGLAALWLVPIPLVRSLGIAGFVVPIIALLVTFTLIPCLLSDERGMAGLLAERGPRFWDRFARRVLARPRTALAASILGCGMLALPLLSVQFAPASLTALPADAPAARAVEFMTRKLGPGVITPHEVLVSVGPGSRATDQRNDAAREALADRISSYPEVFATFSDSTPTYIADDAFQRIFVIGRHAFAAPETAKLVEQLRSLDPNDYGYSDGTSIVVGGVPAQGVDFMGTLRAAMPWIVGLVLLCAFLVLRRVFGSWRVAGMSIAMNLVSLAAASGLVVAIFQFGWGAALLRTYEVAQVESWTFVFMFALLFGLTMDYQVFVVRSMREAGLGSIASDDAIRVGIVNSGSIVTAAAVAFVCALSGLMFGRIAGLQELGYGLAAGVLIDATVVRGIMLPSALAVFGRH